jgi:tetratricopeptide (TPR) repeat protein
MQSGDLQAGTRCGESLLTTLATTPASTSRVLLTAECLLLLNRAEEAVKLLRQQGQSIAPNEVPEPLTVLYARACLAAAANKLQRRNTVDAAETPAVSEGIVKHEDENDPVFLLFVALACDATRYQALDHLTALTLGTGAEARQAETVLQTLRAGGKFAHEILSLTGINAIRSERYDIAVMSLQQARDCAENEDPRILNNLALAMIRSDRDEGEQALELINQALVMLPGHPDLLSTRGEIHVARHQWKHALQDLTTALELRSDNAPIHRLLEQTCSGLNAERQAQIHRQIAERLEGQSRADAMSAN